MAGVYITDSGDTWDLIAYQQLGSEKYMKELMDANWELANVLRFDSGITLVIPDIEFSADSNVPFWRSEDDNSIWGKEAI